MRVGIDVQAIAEVRESLIRHGDRYRRAVFTAGEVEACGGWGADPVVSARGLAARFAGKEAAIKVLRVTDRVPRLLDIEIVREPGGWTRVAWAGLARTLAAESGLTDVEVSLSHADEVAVAVVVGQTAPDGGATASRARVQNDDGYSGHEPDGR